MGYRPTRREFLRMAALTSAMMTPGKMLARAEAESPPDKHVYRTLGRTGIRLPIVSMGSCYEVNLIRAALEKGITYFHSSGGYAEGEHERLLGKALRPFPRDSYLVATSADVPYTYDSQLGRSRDLGTSTDPKRIASSLDDSLRRLALDYVDVYYLGSIGRAETVFHEPYIEVLDRIKRSGKARFVGITTHANEPVVIRAAATSEFWDVVLTAFNFRQSHRENVRAAIGEAAASGVGVVAMKTQAGVYWDRSRKRKINMSAALKWVLQDENVHTSIPAFTNFEQMEEDIAVMDDLEFTEQEKRDLDIGDEMGFSGNFCQQCGDCLPQCPEGVDIPILMRSHMYALAHRQPAKARDTLSTWSANEIRCTACADCQVRCTLGLDVRARALDMAQLLRVSGEMLG